MPVAKNAKAKPKKANNGVKAKPKAKKGPPVRREPETPAAPVDPKMIEMKWAGKELPKNLLDLGRVTQQETMFLLQARYQQDKIYTLMGDVQVAINPFKRVTADVNAYKKASGSKESIAALQPHAYQIAALAFFNLQQTNKDQSVIISGESGAGKTETTKLILQYLTNGVGQDIAEKLLQSSPILEGFGNAKTLRNNNSSRFGKWMVILFDRAQNYTLIGANIVNYLLEKSRVCTASSGERAYHVFYFMCKSVAKHSFLGKFKLKSCGQNNYLSAGGCFDVETINDEKEFDDMMEAFKTFKFSESELSGLFSILAAIVHSGNITYQSSKDAAKVKDKESLKLAAKFFGVDEKQFQKHISTKTIRVRGQETSSPLDTKGCINARDSICKDVYDKLFNWLVIKINSVLSKKTKGKKGLPMIGVLDIFGFEIFETNYFEQFCINFCNEKLQNHFQKYCWDREVSVYEAEGIDYSNITFVNNDKTCDMVENSKKGIVRLIQDEVTMPKGNDASLAARLHGAHGKHPSYQICKNNKMQFEIKHFAGNVRYEVNGFFAKNLDGLTECTKEMLQKSKISLLQKLYPKGGDKKNVKCVGTVFLKSLQSLIKAMNATQPHFIRCIKPNHAKQPGIWEDVMIREQLKFGGIFAYLELRRCGYDVQIPFEQFAAEMMYALRNESDRQQMASMLQGQDYLGCCKSLKPKLMSLYGLIDQDIQFGKNKVFMQNRQYGKLDVAASFWIRGFQRRWRKQHADAFSSMNEERRKRMEAKKRAREEEERKRKEEELRKKLEAERAAKEAEIEAEFTRIEQEGKKEREALQKALQGDMDAVNEEIQRREMDLISPLKLEMKAKESALEVEKQQMRDQMMVDIGLKAKMDAAMANQGGTVEDQKLMERLKLETEALSTKEKMLQANIIRQLKRVKALKVELKKLQMMGGKADIIEKMKHIPRDSWTLGAVGYITERGGCSFYVSLTDAKFGYLGMLSFGDKLLLLSRRGYTNTINDDTLSIKVMLIQPKSKTIQHKEVGFVPLIATSFFTNRTVRNF